MQAQVNHGKSKITENSLCSFNFFISMNYSFNFRPQKTTLHAAGRLALATQISDNLDR